MYTHHKLKHHKSCAIKTTTFATNIIVRLQYITIRFCCLYKCYIYYICVKLLLFFRFYKL